MRIEATIPESHGKAVDDLARQLGLSRSQIVDEALALYLQIVREALRGRRLLLQAAGDSEPACEMTTPTLASLEWARNPVNVHLSNRERDAVRGLLAHPPAPSPRLRAAAKRRPR